LYAEHMPSCYLSITRATAAAVFALSALLSYAEQSGASAGSIVIDGLGKGTAALTAPCQLHLGDNLTWRIPSFDSSDWEQIATDRPWGTQGHAYYTGFAWYRCKVAVKPALGIPPQFSLLVPKVDDAYEIYWNGTLIGGNGKLHLRPVWHFSQPAQIFELGEMQSGILAVRVWKAPLLEDNNREAGGFEAPPLLGSPKDIATAKAALDFQWLQSREFILGEGLLCAVIALLSFLFWRQNPSQWHLFWLACFSLGPPLELLLLTVHTRWLYVLMTGTSQVRSDLRNLSLWFLLLCLLPLRQNRAIARFSAILVYICLTDSALHGALIAICWNPNWIELVRTVNIVIVPAFFGNLLAAFPLALASYAILQRKPLGSARSMVAIFASIYEIVFIVRNVIEQSRGFTDWHFAHYVASQILGSPIPLHTASDASLLFAIVYAVYISVRKNDPLQETLEYEQRDVPLGR
jgi:diguanylate cyclase